MADKIYCMFHLKPHRLEWHVSRNKQEVWDGKAMSKAMGFSKPHTQHFASWVMSIHTEAKDLGLIWANYKN